MAFNKMFVMLPVMLAARKIDGENPDTVFMLRCAYGAVQSIIVLLVAYIYISSRSVSSGKDKDRLIYVPPAPVVSAGKLGHPQSFLCVYYLFFEQMRPPYSPAQLNLHHPHMYSYSQPFEDPNTKKKYTEKKLGAHVASQATSLLGSTLFGICMTVGLHYYKGMIVGLAIQSIMGPLNLFENALAKTVLMGGGLGDGIADRKIFGEKNRSDLTKDDEVVDEQGNPVVRQPLAAGAKQKGGKKAAAATPKKDERSFEDLLLDTWDLGADADMKPLLAALTKKTVNYRTKEDSWTPCMILAAIGVATTKECLDKCKSLGGNPAAVDKEGWNALHWAAYHGSPAGAKYLLSDDGYGGIKLGLADAKDKEGKIPLDHAKAEGNTEVVTIIENATASGEVAASDDGLRKRK